MKRADDIQSLEAAVFINTEICHRCLPYDIQRNVKFGKMRGRPPTSKSRIRMLKWFILKNHKLRIALHIYPMGLLVQRYITELCIMTLSWFTLSWLHVHRSVHRFNSRPMVHYSLNLLQWSLSFMRIRLFIL